MASEDVVGGHDEATAQLFQAFSGCYGYSHKTDWNIKITLPPINISDSIFRCLDSYHGVQGNLRQQ